MNYYLCYITEQNGETEYTSKFLMACSESEDDEVKFEEILLNYRGEGERDPSFGSMVWYQDCLSATDWGYNTVPGKDFSILKKYLSVLGGISDG